jgi:anti-anti-sigma factor
MRAFELERRPDAGIAHIRADIDAENAAALRDWLATCLPHDVSVLIVDLGACPYLDSAGVTMLFQLNGRMRERRRSLRVVIPTESPLVRLAEIVGLGEEVALHASVEDALGRRPAGAEASASGCT